VARIWVHWLYMGGGWGCYGGVRECLKIPIENTKRVYLKSRTLELVWHRKCVLCEVISHLCLTPPKYAPKDQSPATDSSFKRRQHNEVNIAGIPPPESPRHKRCSEIFGEYSAGGRGCSKSNRTHVKNEEEKENRIIALLFLVRLDFHVPANAV
jgi:hypothetical protein